MKRLASYLLILVAVAAVAQSSPKPSPTKPYACVAGPDEQCASDLWYADYKKYMAMVNKYKAPQEVQDLINGMAMRLNGQIPAGFRWDEAKQRFVKNPPVPAEKK